MNQVYIDKYWSPGFDSIEEYVFLLDDKYNIIKVNKSFVDLSGKKAEEIIGSKCYSIIHSLKEPVNNYPYSRMLKSNKFESLEIFEPNLNKWLYVRTTPLFDNNKKLIGGIHIASDITAKKKAQEELRESAIHFQDIINNSPFITVIYNPDGTPEYFNLAHSEVLGITLKEQNYMKKNYNILNDEQLVEKGVMPYIKKAFEGYPMKVPVIDYDPEQTASISEIKHKKLFFSGSIFPLKDEFDKVVNVIFILEDITEQKKAKEQIESLARFPSENPYPVMRVTKEGSIIYANASSTKILKHWGAYVGAKIPPQIIEIVTQCFKEKTIKRFEVSLKNITFLFVATSIVQEGYVNLYGVDISKRKIAEEFLKNIFESVGEGFAIVDKNYKIITANKAYCTQYNQSIKNVIDKKCHEISHQMNKPCFESGEECAVKKTFKTGKPYTTYHTHYDINNNPVSVEIRSYPMKDEAGKVHSVIEFVNDITEKTLLESQLRHAQKMELIGQLAGGVAHDFNNVLSAIFCYAEILQMTLKDEEQKQNVSEILTSAERASDLTRNLLAFSRKNVMYLEAVNLNIIINNLKKFFLTLIGENIEIKIKLTNEDLNLKADIGQIEQVFMNLISNARDSMPQGGVLSIETKKIEIDKIFVKTHGYGTSGMYACVSVADTGTGMDAETKNRIFEPFFTTKEVGKGTGLGLAMVYGTIKQHGGFINIYSEEGVGTTFNIYLPLDVKKYKQKKTEIKQYLLKGGNETVLLAEDDDNLRNITIKLLANAGYKVIHALDGNDAVQKFNKYKDKIDLLIFDIIMPKKSGKEAYDEIKKISPDVKIIFTSGYDEDIISKNLALEKGFPIFLKPISPSKFLEKIREVLDK